MYVCSLGEGVSVLALLPLVQVPHELPEDERVDILAQLVEEEPVPHPGPSADRLDLGTRQNL